MANPAIVDAKPTPDGKAVMVTGVSEGTSEVRIERLEGTELTYKIHVHGDIQEVVNEIKELLADIEGLEIKTLGDKIVLKGNVVTKSDYDKVQKVAGAYGGNILDMTKFDRTGMNKYVEDAISKDLQSIGITTVTVRADDNSVILDGVVFSEGDKRRAEEWAHRRMPTVTSQRLWIQRSEESGYRRPRRHLWRGHRRALGQLWRERDGLGENQRPGQQRQCEDSELAKRQLQERLGSPRDGGRRVWNTGFGKCRRDA